MIPLALTAFSQDGKYFVPRLTKIWADQAHQGQNLADWCRATGEWDLEVVKRPPGVRGWSQQPTRWIVERTFAWLLRSRRLVVDYERNVQTSETFIEVSFIATFTQSIFGR